MTEVFKITSENIALVGPNVIMNNRTKSLKCP